MKYEYLTNYVLTTKYVPHEVRVLNDFDGRINNFYNPCDLFGVLFIDYVNDIFNRLQRRSRFVVYNNMLRDNIDDCEPIFMSSLFINLLKHKTTTYKILFVTILKKNVDKRRKVCDRLSFYTKLVWYFGMNIFCKYSNNVMNRKVKKSRRDDGIQKEAAKGISEIFFHLKWVKYLYFL